MIVANYEDALSLKYIDDVIDAAPKEMINAGVEVMVSYNIYQKVKPYLKDNKYKNILVKCDSLMSEETLLLKSKSKYHN